mmetsp:Transcript_23816/g.52097  ORF Transcript_23816/g.52097 Transcript_23816/m.52097 type:complete len:235 (+) Transcript_23816:199-903(+)
MHLRLEAAVWATHEDCGRPEASTLYHLLRVQAQTLPDLFLTETAHESLHRHAQHGIRVQAAQHSVVAHIVEPVPVGIEGGKGEAQHRFLALFTRHQQAAEHLHRRDGMAGRPRFCARIDPGRHGLDGDPEEVCPSLEVPAFPDLPGSGPFSLPRLLRSCAGAVHLRQHFVPASIKFLVRHIEDAPHKEGPQDQLRSGSCAKLTDAAEGYEGPRRAGVKEEFHNRPGHGLRRSHS